MPYNADNHAPSVGSMQRSNSGKKTSKNPHVASEDDINPPGKNIPGYAAAERRTVAYEARTDEIMGRSSTHKKSKRGR